MVGGLGSSFEYSGLGGKSDFERRRLRPPVRPECRMAGGASVIRISES